MPDKEYPLSPYIAGGHVHAYCFTCYICLSVALYTYGGLRHRAVLRDCAAAARLDGWSKTKHGWAHRACTHPVDQLRLF